MWGTFCYKVMPFGLKNAGVMYQRAMMTLFHDMMHKEIEVYVDDMIVKSQGEDDHVINLKKVVRMTEKIPTEAQSNKMYFWRNIRKIAKVCG